jgi:hypothetical protein
VRRVLGHRRQAQEAGGHAAGDGRCRGPRSCELARLHRAGGPHAPSWSTRRGCDAGQVQSAGVSAFPLAPILRAARLSWVRGTLPQSVTQTKEINTVRHTPSKSEVLNIIEAYEGMLRPYVFSGKLPANLVEARAKWIAVLAQMAAR